MSELSDGVQEIEAWVAQGKSTLDELVVDYGVEDSVQQALETYKVSSLGDMRLPCRRESCLSCPAATQRHDPIVRDSSTLGDEEDKKFHATRRKFPSAALRTA